MNQYNFLINKNNLNINKCTIKGKAVIIDTDEGKYVLKEKNNYKLFKYLESKKFFSFPSIIDFDRENGMYEFIDNLEYDDEEKALDLIRIIAVLHHKTSYYKEITNDEMKSLYEDISLKIDYIYNYYLDIINIIENKIYPSPAEYLLERNISNVFSAIFFCKNEIEKWYETTKELKRKRVVTLHNNLDTSNLLKNDELYLISWNSKIDMPIFDLIQFYNKRCLDFDFEFLFNEYESICQLNKYEKDLLMIIISIPNKIVFNDNEYDNVKEVRKILDKIYKTSNILKSKEAKETANTTQTEHKD